MATDTAIRSLQVFGGITAALLATVGFGTFVLWNTNRKVPALKVRDVTQSQIAMLLLCICFLPRYVGIFVLPTAPCQYFLSAEAVLMWAALDLALRLVLKMYFTFDLKKTRVDQTFRKLEQVKRTSSVFSLFGGRVSIFQPQMGGDREFAGWYARILLVSLNSSWILLILSVVLTHRRLEGHRGLCSRSFAELLIIFGRCCVLVAAFVPIIQKFRVLTDSLGIKRSFHQSAMAGVLLSSPLFAFAVAAFVARLDNGVTLEVLEAFMPIASLVCFALLFTVPGIRADMQRRKNLTNSNPAGETSIGRRARNTNDRTN